MISNCIGTTIKPKLCKKIMLGCASSFNFCRKANSLNLIYTFYSVVNFTICQMTVPSFLLTATIVELCFYGLYYHKVHFFNNGVSLGVN